MLRLTHDQADLVEQVLLRRHAASVAAVLQEAWPAVIERLKERWGPFVELALQHAHRHEIVEPTDLAAYANLWCLWGAAWEDKPGFEWAREILDDLRRTPPLKVHQLLHRSRDELARQQQPRGPQAAPVPTLAQFDAALQAVRTKMAAQSTARAIYLDLPPPPPIVACDVATVDLQVVEIADALEYKLNAGLWQRVKAPKLALPATSWTRAPDETPVFALTSNALRAGPAARLNLKLTPLAVCNPAVHPQVTHDAAAGRLSWKGRDAARLSLALYAPPARPIDPKLGPPGIAARSDHELQQVQIASCGLRDAGAPFGDAAIELQVYPATQWLCEVRHGGFPAMAWPAQGASEPVPPNAVVCKLEADGRAVEAALWQRGWAGLHGQFRAGMEKLFNAWSRAMDGTTARLQVEAAPLVGQAGLTWGWRRTAADAVVLRTEGQLDWIACALDLRLAGEIASGGGRARMALACKGRSELRMAVEQLGDEGEDARKLAAAKCSWRFPFAIEIEPLATGALAMLNALPVPEAMLGAIAGECGLRVRPDGQGLQWYFTLRAEPVTVQLAASDPILGTSRQRVALLPALPLVDWSAG